MKALRGVDFTKFALSTIIYLMQSSQKMAKLQTLLNCQKIFFQHQTSSCTSSINISVTYLQSVEKTQQKLLRRLDFTKYALPTIIYQVQSLKKWLG